MVSCTLFLLESLLTIVVAQPQLSVYVVPLTLHALVVVDSLSCQVTVMLLEDLDQGLGFAVCQMKKSADV